MTRIGVVVMLACWSAAASAKPPTIGPPPPPMKQPAVRVTVESKRALAVTSLTADAVVAKIQAAYAASIRRCYGEAVARSPNARGKVVLGFEVTPGGETTAVRITAFEPRLEACIAGQVAAWRFPIPRSAEGGPVAARFEVGYRLQTETDAIGMSQEDAQRLANLMTSDPDPSSGSMSARRPGASLDSQIAEVREADKSVAIGGGGGRGSRSGQGTAGGTSVGMGGGGGSAKAPDASSTPPGRVTVSNKQTFDSTTLDTNTVMRKVLSAYMAGIKRCYKQRLTQDPAARGSVTLAFDVDETGRVRAGKATSFEPSIGACIEGLMSTWRFPVPKDRDGEPTRASFQIKLTLVPD